MRQTAMKLQALRLHYACNRTFKMLQLYGEILFEIAGLPAYADAIKKNCNVKQKGGVWYRNETNVPDIPFCAVKDLRHNKR